MKIGVSRKTRLTPKVRFLISIFRKEDHHFRGAEVNCGRRRHCGTGLSISAGHLGGRAVVCGSRFGCGLLRGLRFPGAEVYIPAAVELTAVYVEAHCHHVAYVERELIHAVAEEIERYLFGIGLQGFENIFTLFPCVSGTGGAPYFGKGNNYFPVTSIYSLEIIFTKVVNLPR